MISRASFRKILPLAAACCLGSTLTAQTEAPAKGVELTAAGVNVRVQFIRENNVRVTKRANGANSERPSLSVLKRVPADLETAVKSEGAAILITSRLLTVRVSRRTGNVQYLTPGGSIIVKETAKTRSDAGRLRIGFGLFRQTEFRALAGKGKGAGLPLSRSIDRSVRYRGTTMMVKL